MKKIIGGKVYDTEKARLLGDDGGEQDNFRHWHEELYQKRTGEFFLYGEGGPASKYAESVGLNQWSGGSKIIPLDMAAAREWAEAHLSVDEYETIFGLPDEGAERVALNVMLPAPLAARLRTRAAEQGTSVTSCLEEILTSALEHSSNA